MNFLPKAPFYQGIYAVLAAAMGWMIAYVFSKRCHVLLTVELYRASRRSMSKSRVILFTSAIAMFAVVCLHMAFLFKEVQGSDAMAELALVVLSIFQVSYNLSTY
jgi:uncharacterized membrane protein